MQDCIPVSIDINDVPPTFCVSQFDNLSRRVILRIHDNDNPDETKINLTGHHVCLFCVLPDGETSVRIDGTVTDEENGEMQFLLTDAVTASAGAVQATPVICSGNDVISLRRFSFGVLPTAVEKEELDDWVESIQ